MWPRAPGVLASEAYSLVAVRIGSTCAIVRTAGVIASTTATTCSPTAAKRCWSGSARSHARST
ncbi:hypothetical protein ACPA9J_25310 [Pseudomonas aeruginosa]